MMRKIVTYYIKVVTDFITTVQQSPLSILKKALRYCLVGFVCFSLFHFIYLFVTQLLSPSPKIERIFIPNIDFILGLVGAYISALQLKVIRIVSFITFFTNGVFNIATTLGSVIVCSDTSVSDIVKVAAAFAGIYFGMWLLSKCLDKFFSEDDSSNNSKKGNKGDKKDDGSDSDNSDGGGSNDHHQSGSNAVGHNDINTIVSGKLEEIIAHQQNVRVVNVEEFNNIGLRTIQSIKNEQSRLLSESQIINDVVKREHSSLAELNNEARVKYIPNSDTDKITLATRFESINCARIKELVASNEHLRISNKPVALAEISPDKAELVIFTLNTLANLCSDPSDVLTSATTRFVLLESLNKPK